MYRTRAAVTAATLYADQQTLARLKAGDRATQAAVFEDQHGRLRAIARRLLPSAADAEALIADLFVDFFFKFVHEVRSAKAIPSYLRIMAVRRAQKLRLRAARHERAVEESLDANAPRASEAIERAVNLRRLEECLRTLTSRARTVLKLQYGHGLSFAEAGAHLGCSKQAVGKMAQKSLESLRRCMEAFATRQGRGA